MRTTGAKELKYPNIRTLQRKSPTPLHCSSDIFEDSCWKQFLCFKALVRSMFEGIKLRRIFYLVLGFVAKNKISLWLKNRDETYFTQRNLRLNRVWTQPGPTGLNLHLAKDTGLPWFYLYLIFLISHLPFLIHTVHSSHGSPNPSSRISRAQSLCC
jgi:hypothetical protein